MTKPFSADDFANLRLDLRRAVILRWWLLAAATVAVLSAPTFLDLALPRLPMLLVIALMLGFNGFAHHRARSMESIRAGELFGQLCVDLTALGILLYLSGGAANPLISLLLVPVAVAALSLPGTLTAVVALLSIVIYSLLVRYYLPLPVVDAERATQLHLTGMWLTFVVSVIMIAWFVARMTASIRERDTRLAAAREQALRDERVVALGALAAGAAHELGTPLATISVIVGELAQEVFQNVEVHADLALVQEQIARCKGIISGLSARSGTPRPECVEIVDARVWIEGVRARWHAMRPRAVSRLTLNGVSRAPMIAIEGTLEQALGSLLNNAADATPVTGAGIGIALTWNDVVLKIAVSDGGPGFSDKVLRLAGQAPLATGSGGAGIGLLLAFSAIERMGGRILLDNPPGGGGRACIDLPIVRSGEE